MPDETPQSTSSPPTRNLPRLRRLRLPPVWLMVIVAGLLAVAALFLHFWLPWRQRLAVVREIEGVNGGFIRIDQHGSDWLREWFGQHLGGTTLNPRIGPLDEFRGVSLARQRRHPTGWKPLAGEISPDLIESLQVFPSLEHLDLSHSNITDEWMSCISQISALRRLDLSHCDVSAQGLASLSRLGSLERVDLVGCPIEDADLESLIGFPSLKEVYLGDCTRLTTDGVAHFLDARPDLRASLTGLDDMQAELLRRSYSITNR